MFDPYEKETPVLGEPAANLVDIVPNDDIDIPLGVKALRIFNPNAAVATIHAITIAGSTVQFPVPSRTAIACEFIRNNQSLGLRFNTTYIRDSSGHNEAPCNNGDLFSLRSFRDALFGKVSMVGQGRSFFTIERVG